MPSSTPSCMSILWANSWSTTSRPNRGFAASRRAARHDTISGPSPWCDSPSTAWGERSNVPRTGPAVWRWVIEPSRTMIAPTPSYHDSSRPRIGSTAWADDDGAHLVGQLEATGGLPAPLAQQPVGELAEAVTLGIVEQSPQRRAGVEDLPPPSGSP